MLVGVKRIDPTPQDESIPSLSIVIPFHNSQANSARLLSTLSGLTHSFLEVICVDDGSTDETTRVLGDFAAACRLPVKIIAQQNGGPGKARNTGLRHARGEYVWFVDCDDDIQVAAIDHFSELRSRGFDFIDFGLEEVGSGVINTMGLAEGAYDVSSDMRSYLVGSYGAIWTKVTRRELLVSNGIWYPEFCFYEDNLLSSILPFYVKRFHRASLVGYRHHLDFESVTRQKLGPRYFDRLHTSAWGFAAGCQLAADLQDLVALEDRFIDLFFVKTTNQIFGMHYPNTGFLNSLRNGRFLEAASRFFAHVASLWYLRSWLLSARVHRYYREVAKGLNVRRSPMTRVTRLDKQGRAPWRSIWISSYLLGSQRKRFEELRMTSWGLTSAGSVVWPQPKHSGAPQPD